MPFEIACADCGQAYAARRRTAKVCPACRLIRNVTYAAKKFRRVRSCRACGQKYRPIHAQDFSHCGTCTQSHQDTTAGECGICHHSKALLPGTRVCVECLKDPELQQKALRGLRKAQAQRKRDNAPRA